MATMVQAIRLALHVGEGGSDCVNDGAQSVGHLKAPHLETSIGNAHPGSPLGPDVDDVADADTLHRLADTWIGRRTVCRIAGIAGSQRKIADRVRQDGVRIDGGRDLVQLGGPDLQARRDDIAISLERDGHGLVHCQ